ncbi:MAG: hypothetical protein Q8N44_07845 [Rubrivivax sp.]|nr:hypothetical protein [Rubrivivax sp.]
MYPTAQATQSTDSVEGPVTESWMYRSEAFAEDLDDLAPSAAPALGAERPRSLPQRSKAWFGARTGLLNGLRRA